SHHLPVAEEVRILINRLFMVFILMIAVQLFKARALIQKLLVSVIQIPRRYFYRVIQLLCLLIPFTLIFNAVIGLFGYVELAWTVANYQVLFVLVLAGYLIIRGLMFDAMEYFSQLLIRFVQQGWLWTEAILKPIDRTLRVILFFMSALFLLHLYHL